MVFLMDFSIASFTEAWARGNPFFGSFLSTRGPGPDFAPGDGLIFCHRHFRAKKNKGSGGGPDWPRDFKEILRGAARFGRKRATPRKKYYPVLVRLLLEFSMFRIIKKTVKARSEAGGGASFVGGAGRAKPVKRGGGGDLAITGDHVFFRLLWDGNCPFQKRGPSIFLLRLWFFFSGGKVPSGDREGAKTPILAGFIVLYPAAGGAMEKFSFGPWIEKLKTKGRAHPPLRGGLLGKGSETIWDWTYNTGPGRRGLKNLGAQNRVLH